MDKTLYDSYVTQQWKLLPTIGDSPANTEADPVAYRKTAKVSVVAGFTEPAYRGMTLVEVTRAEARRQWIAGLIPPEVTGLDSENPGSIAAADEILRACKPPAPQFTTKCGKQWFCKATGIAGISQPTKTGFPITYRAPGKNYTILPPSDNRSWQIPLNGGIPNLPEELYPADLTVLDDVIHVFGWHVGDTLRKKLLTGYEDIDMACMSFLNDRKLNSGQIHQVFRKIYLSEYSESVTAKMFERLRDLKQSNKPYIGGGSFIKSLKDRGLTDLLTYAQDLERVTGTQKFSLAGQEWQDPIPLTEYSSLPKFPTEVLPKTGRDFVRNVATVTQVDEGLPGCIYLASIAVAIAKKYNVGLRTHWEPLNIYTAPISDPGERRTTTLAIMCAPLYKYQKDKRELLKRDIRESQNRCKVLEGRLARLQKQAAHTEDQTERSQFIDQANDVLEEMEQNPVLVAPQYLADDVTNEALFDIMAEQGERVGVFSTEGGVFTVMTGLYSEKYNMDIWLKGHAGDEISKNRVASGSKQMDSPALTACLAVQYDVLREIGANRRFRGRGFTARWQYGICESQVGGRHRQESTIDTAAQEAYERQIIALMEIPTITPTPLIPLADDAQKQWNLLYNEIEGEMLPGGPLKHIRDWGSKLPGAVARLAGILHFSEHGAGASSQSISLKTTIAACALGEFFKAHAIAAFGLMQEDPRIEAAKAILSYIKAQHPTVFKARDILRHKNIFKTVEDILPGLKVLTERGYIREKLKEYAGVGRPEAMEYEVNPKIYI